MGGHGAFETASQRMKILNAEYLTTVVTPEKRKFTEIPEICFIGRSNVGKSSLINRLVLRKIARTSSTPGATKAINLYKIHYEFEELRKWVIFSDFPGFGYAKVAKSIYSSWEVMIDTYITINPSIQRLAWVFDIRREPDALDETVLEWAWHRRLPFCIIITKSDKEGRSYIMRKKDILARKFQINDIFVFSAKTGYGRDDVLTYLISSVATSKNNL